MDDEPVTPQRRSTDDVRVAPLGNGGSRPVPDPTELTDKAIARSEKSIMSYVDGQVAIVEGRMAAMDEATRLRLASVTEIPGMIAGEVGHLRDLTDEKFSASERHRVEQKADTKQAVDAALSAASAAVKEQTTASERAIAKSETATGAQLKQMQDTFATAIDGLRRTLEDAKERESDDVRILRQAIADVATIANGTVQQRTGAKEDRTGMYATIGLAVTVVLFLIAIVVFFADRVAMP